MAQIVTITNPLTGQPAQVDQLEHTAQQIDDGVARALPGGEIDALLSNKAPAGYGLGGSYGGYIADADNATVDGKYRTNSGTLNLPDGVDGMFGVIDVTTTRPDKVLLQKFCPGTDGYPPYSLERRRIVGVWKPWEWVNPPMAIDVEYRTTERFMGKPVYVKLVDFGPGANNTEKRVKHGASNAIVIDYGGYIKDSNGALSIPWISYSTLSVSSADIVMTANANYSGFNAYVWIKYYKTTD